MYIEDEIKPYSSGARLLTQAAFTRGRQAVFQFRPELPLKCLPISTDGRLAEPTRTLFVLAEIVAKALALGPDIAFIFLAHWDGEVDAVMHGNTMTP